MSRSESVAELLHRRNQRLQKILKVIIVIGFLGVLSTLPSFLLEGDSATTGIASFFSLTILVLFYFGCYWLTLRARHDVARHLLFSCWALYAFVQLQLYSPTIEEPMLGMLFMSIALLFYAVIIIGIVSLDLWPSARRWIGVVCVSYVLGSVVSFVRHVDDMALPRLYVITVGVCFLLLLCIIAFARAFTSDLNQLLEQSETARHTEVELRQQTEVSRDNAMQASLIKSQFLANMSHELRTPLSAIIGYVELIREEADDLDIEAFDDDLTQIRSAATHLNGLINDILDLSKIEAGKLEIHASIMPLEPMLTSVQDTIKPMMAKNHNTLTIINEADISAFECDEVRCKQILLNLLSNASKFTSQGSVVLRVTSSPDAISFEVKDTGIGIPEDKLEKIFAPFEQADGSTTREYGGTGLGLPISARLVEMMGGTMDVHSTPGVGSRFCMHLPL